MAALPTFSLVYTSVRPQYIPYVVQLWNERAVNQGGLEWVIAVDEGDEPSLLAAQNASAAATATPVKVIVNTGSKDSTTGWNTGCAIAVGKVFVIVSDDFMPPLRWDESLLSLEPSGWPDQDRAVHVEDGYVHNLMVLPIVTKIRYDKFGYLYYPKYRSLFGDTELTDVAYRDGVVIDARHLLFEHCHPDCAKRPRDAVDLVHASRDRWNAGEMLYNFRKARGFPLDDGPRAVAVETPEAANPDVLFAVYMQVTKDDLCLGPVCIRLAEEGLKNFFFAIPNRYWSGEPVTEEDVGSLQPVFNLLIQRGCNVQIKHFDLEQYRVGAESRIVLETRVRNDSLTWVRKQGFEHILIVDGDELWPPGTLNIIRPFVEQGHPAISLRMIPVMGTPGYPVNNAQDLAVVYIGKGCHFRACRTPTARQTIVEEPRIIHFTSTRRTLEENIAKHRRSGHYDDPEYAFEDWLKNKLPHAKPGLVNAHMFTRYSIWPVLRHWRPEELAIIPDEIKPYLGT